MPGFQAKELPVIERIEFGDTGSDAFPRLGEGLGSGGWLGVGGLRNLWFRASCFQARGSRLSV